MLKDSLQLLYKDNTRTVLRRERNRAEISPKKSKLWCFSVLNSVLKFETRLLGSKGSYRLFFIDKTRKQHQIRDDQTEEMISKMCSEVDLLCCRIDGEGIRRENNYAVSFIDSFLKCFISKSLFFFGGISNWDCFIIEKVRLFRCFLLYNPFTVKIKCLIIWNNDKKEIKRISCCKLDRNI